MYFIGEFHYSKLFVQKCSYIASFSFITIRRTKKLILFLVDLIVVQNIIVHAQMFSNQTEKLQKRMLKRIHGNFHRKFVENCRQIH